MVKETIQISDFSLMLQIVIYYNLIMIALNIGAVIGIGLIFIFG